MAEIFTEDKIIQLKEAREKAMEDTTPFPVMKDGDLAVVGDANKTEINKHDFVLTFIVPEGGGYKEKIVEYKDVWLSPRRAVAVQRLMTALQPLFYKVGEGGKIQDLSEDEMLDVVVKYEGDVLDQLYHLVATVLGVDERIADFIEPNSALNAFHQIMLSYPDLLKASDSFFAFLSGKETGPSKNE